MNKKLSISIQATDLLNLEYQINKFIDTGIDSIHLDIMDINYANNFAFGPDYFKAIRKKFGKKILIDVHTMITKPSKTLKYFISKLDPDILVNDVQSLTESEHLDIIKFGQIKGIKMGISIPVEEKISKWKKVLEAADVIMLMAVPIGKAGQPFNSAVLDNANWVNKNIEMTNKYLAIDGGVRDTNIESINAHQFNFIILGSAYKEDDDYDAITRKFR